jgi:hypothetical protein
MEVLADRISTLALVITVALLAGDIISQKAFAQEVDLDTLCRDFPLNSRCKDHKFPSQKEENNNTAKTLQVIKLHIDDSEKSEEWVRIEVDGNRLKLLHTIKNPSGVSEAINGVSDAVLPIPLPLPNLFSKWEDHQTTRVVFKPDSCLANLVPEASQANISQNSSCEITGDDSVVLPEGTDFSQGRFTMEYTQGEASVLKSLSFRIPVKKIQQASNLK